MEIKKETLCIYYDYYLIATHQLYHMNFINIVQGAVRPCGIPPASVAAPPEVSVQNLHCLGVADDSLWISET